MKKFNISFAILLLIMTNSFIYSNPIVSGRITTTNSTPIFQAKISFVNVVDTSRRFSSLSDTLGIYNITITSIKNSNEEAAGFQLYQNYPNPFSERTTITYQIKQQAPVIINIYNVLGQRVKTFRQEFAEQNIGQVQWDGRDGLGKKVANGIYFYAVSVEDKRQVKKMLFIDNIITGGTTADVFRKNANYYLEDLYRDSGNVYTVYIENTDSTKPKIEPLKIENVVIQGDTVINFQVEEAPKWEFLGLEKETIISIATHPNDELIIYAGSSYDFSAGHMGKLFKSTNSGRTWDTLIVGQPLFSFINTVIDPFHPETVYTTPLPILKSTNGGSTWFDISNGIRIDWETRASSIAIDPKNSNILYAGTAGFFGGRFYKSTNGGESWRDLSRGTPEEDTLREGVISIAIDPNNSNIVYAGTPMSGELWKTTDAGETWILTGLGVTNQMIDAVAVDPFNGNKVYASVRFMGFFLSNDGGITWENLQLPDTIIGGASILLGKLQPGLIILATTKGCLMKRGDNSDWYFLNEGLEGFSYNAFNTIEFYRNENFLLGGRTTFLDIGGIYVRRIQN